MSAALAAVLLVGLPLAAALLAVVSPRASAPLAAPLSAATLALAAILAAAILSGGPVTVAIGGHVPPLGIALHADGLAAVFILAGALVAGATLVFARAEFAGGRAAGRAAWAFWPLAWFAVAALNTVFLSPDLFNLYVALELLTLAAIGLVALKTDGDTLAAALRYLFFAFIGALLYLLGVVLLYAEYGTLDVGLLAARAEANAVTAAAGALMTAGLAAKAALFPLHGWLPPAHAGAPTPASALLSALVPKAAFFILFRVWFEALGSVAAPAVPVLLAALGSLAILFGSAMALRQARLKLVIAWSTVAQVGYLFLVFPLAGGGGEEPFPAGAWTGGVLHALSHATAKAAMFLAAGLVIERLGHDRISGLGGLGRAMPATVFSFALAAVTLMGLPPSGGFVAKYLMLTAAVAADRPLIVLVLVGGGLLAAVYLFRPLQAMMARPERGAPPGRVHPREMLPLALAAASILVGIGSAFPSHLAAIGRPPAALEGLP